MKQQETPEESVQKIPSFYDWDESAFSKMMVRSKCLILLFVCELHCIGKKKIEKP